MRRAILWGILGLLLGVAIYPMISVFIFRTPVQEGTSGCVGLVLGIILFVIGLQVSKQKKSEQAAKQTENKTETKEEDKNK
jgi:uncharacterized protein YacL